MLRDSVGLIVALFTLIVSFSVMTPVVFTLIDEFTDLNEDVNAYPLSVTIKAVYSVIYGILGIGIFVWYFSRSHREEHEPDYFTTRGWQFPMPKYSSYPYSKRFWKKYNRRF